MSVAGWWTLILAIFVGIPFLGYIIRNDRKWKRDNPFLVEEVKKGVVTWVWDAGVEE